MIRHLRNAAIAVVLLGVAAMIAINAIMLDYIEFLPFNKPVRAPANWLLVPWRAVAPQPAADMVPVYIRPFRFAVPGPWRVMVLPGDGAVSYWSAASQTLNLAAFSRSDAEVVGGGSSGRSRRYSGWLEMGLPKYDNDFDLLCHEHSVTERDLSLLRWPPANDRIRGFLQCAVPQNSGLTIANHAAVDIALEHWNTGDVSHMTLFSRERQQSLTMSIGHNDFHLQPSKSTYMGRRWLPASIPGIPRPALSFTPPVIQAFIDSVSVASPTDHDALVADMRQRGELALQQGDWSMATLLLALAQRGLTDAGQPADPGLASMTARAQTENEAQILAAFKQRNAQRKKAVPPPPPGFNYVDDATDREDDE